MPPPLPSVTSAIAGSSSSSTLAAKTTSSSSAASTSTTTSSSSPSNNLPSSAQTQPHLLLPPPHPLGSNLHFHHDNHNQSVNPQSQFQPPQDERESKNCFGWIEAGKWKREQIPDHKFDYMAIDEFAKYTFSTKFAYFILYLAAIKSIVVYMADLGLVVLLLINQSFSSILSNECPSAPSDSLTSFIPPSYRQYIILATIILSYLLLLIDWKKAKKIIESHDISSAFTSVIVYRYYALRSYAHFCFFQDIQSSQKIVDILAFYVFFRFKGWKRLLLAEFPRQFLNFLNLYDVVRKVRFCHPSSYSNFLEEYISIGRYVWSRGQNEGLAFSLSTATVLIWMIAALGLLVSFFIYIPLLTIIRGNLKEYCCHKIDKRITQLLNRKAKKRQILARKAELKALSEQHQQRISGKSTPPPTGGGEEVSHMSVVGSASSANIFPATSASNFHGAAHIQPILPQMRVDLNEHYTEHRAYSDGDLPSLSGHSLSDGRHHLYHQQHSHSRHYEPYDLPHHYGQHLEAVHEDPDSAAYSWYPPPEHHEPVAMYYHDPAHYDHYHGHQQHYEYDMQSDHQHVPAEPSLPIVGETLTETPAAPPKRSSSFFPP